MKAYGKRTWLVPDAYLNSQSANDLKSHEALCVVNTGESDAKIDLTLFFEDSEPRSGFTLICPAMRTRHFRLDKLTDLNGEGVWYDTPYAILLCSSEPVTVQYSRLDASRAELALMTTMAYEAD